MTKKLRWFVFALAAFGMGIGMPQCPGQQAMQQQIDSMQTIQGAQTKKVQAMDTQVRTAMAELDQVKQAMTQATNVLQTQRTAMEQMDAAVKDLQQKIAAMSKPARGRRHK